MKSNTPSNCIRTERHRYYPRRYTPEMFLNKKVPEWVLALIAACLAAGIMALLLLLNH